jgi:hypothetical protein
MSNRDFAAVALGRFLVVERYRETCLSSSTSQLGGRGPVRTGALAGKPETSSGSRTPARPEQR